MAVSTNFQDHVRLYAANLNNAFANTVNNAGDTINGSLSINGQLLVNGAPISVSVPGGNQTIITNNGLTVNTGTSITVTGNNTVVFTANNASVTQAGVVRLNDTIFSTSTTLAATANAVNTISNLFNTSNNTFTSNVKLLQSIIRNAQVSNPLINGNTTSNATVTWVAGANVDPTLTQQWNYFSSPTGFDLSGGTPANSANTIYFPSAWLFPSAGQLSALPGFTTNASPVFYFSPTVWKVRFYTSANTTEIHGARADANSNFHVIIDNKYATPPGGLNPNVSGSIRISFNGVRANRLIEIDGCNASGFRGAYMTLLDDVWSPQRAPELVIDGDSYTFGGGVSVPTDPHAVWARQMAMLLGLDKNTRQVGVSSTGYLSIGNPFPGAGLSTLRTRLLTGGWQDANPMIVVSAAGYNDVTWINAGNVTVAQVATEVGLYSQAVRATYPNVLLFIQGPFGGRRGPDANTIALDAAMANTVANLHDSKTWFISVNNTLPKAWMYGTGNVVTPDGTGNSDWATSSDQTHPSNAGHALLGARSAEAIYQIINSL